ncbi:hypothetical protein BHM03_00014220 [Ensete ventricosum]|nr:hypothetical protein BHM03_00014220 [Ensete ventricosum]
MLMVTFSHGYHSSLCFIQADVIERLRLQHKKDLLKIVDIVLSHQVLFPNPFDSYVTYTFCSGDEDQAQERINKLAKILKENTLSSDLQDADVRVISCIIQRDEGRVPMRHSFHWSAEKMYYEEEPLLRQLEPPLSTFLELEKLKGYRNLQYTSSRDRQWHLYTTLDSKAVIRRMFLRTLLRQPSTINGFASSQVLDTEISRAQPSLSFTSISILRSLMAALEELELHVHNTTTRSDHSHMYICILREQQLHDLLPPSRLVLHIIYREVEDINSHEMVYHSVTPANGPLHAWGTPLVPASRSSGLNDVGMIAWLMEMSTPEFPDGRKIIVVANDVTFRVGSFGPREDAFFHAVTNLACDKKLPLIYLAANSGARIGAAEEVKSCFKVGWSDESSPERGFHYIYLTPEDYQRIGSSVIAHELKLENGEIRWVIDTIVGKADDLGVENLSGSGAIAGAYSKAYNEIFTLTYVTGRTVGIGAYLARLGMRCIQRLDQPIILTGFSTLNKLLGREVYSSHMQLGGPKIMATNGVVHLTVSDDLEGISAILRWLSYVPPYIGGPLPILRSLDPPERLVEYFPENSCDPRAAICGSNGNNGKWLGGIFDKDSFIETLEGWAKTVVTGRAKLGGIPVGVIAVETQTVMQIIPADPGQLDSHERVVPQAGQVWFPDSATKTAQALLDFNREELPLFILANWRGFSGGQRDLFEGILQAGSTIVENLRTYKQPVFVYIPMTGELRGGAWVVVDSKINPEHIEMYAERTAKGNVLEPEGMIEIKFRTKDLIECMGRLDHEIISLKAKLQDIKAGIVSGDAEALRKSIMTREKKLLPVYTQIATQFAELHDTSLRMAAKGVIKKVVDWEDSRFFFYKRLHRRVSEGSLVRTVRNAAGEQLSYTSALELLNKWFLASDQAGAARAVWEDDDAFFSWRDDSRNYEKYLEELRVQKVFKQLMELGESPSDLQVLPQCLSAVLSKVWHH